MYALMHVRAVRANTGRVRACDQRTHLLGYR